MKGSRFLLVILACVTFAYPGIAQTSAETEAPYSGAEFRRWSAIVSNLDESIYLFTNILGLQLGDVTTDPKTSYVYEVFAIDSTITTRHATFHAGDNKRVLSIVEVPGVELQRPPQSPRMSAALFNANGRFDEIVITLREEGYEILTPHILGENGMEIGFIDGDGHLYALYEYPYVGTIFRDTE